MLESRAVERDGDAYLLEGERSDTRHVEDVRHWITIYTELLAFSERALARTRQTMGRMSPSARSEVALGDERMLTEHIARLQRRLAFWRRRLSELGGIDFDPHSRRLAHRGRSVALTRRESELFAYLLAHPNRFFSAEQLVLQAWQAPDLSTEQLRSYVVRLRRHLRTLRLPCDLVSEPRQGYALNVEAS